MTQEPELAVLLERLAKRDAAALEPFVDATLRDLYHFVYLRVGSDVADTEDVLQEVYGAVLEGAASFRGEAPVFAWLFGIARNKVLRVHRQRARNAVEVLLADCDAELVAALGRVETAEIPEEAARRSETRELVGATLATLPPDYKRALKDKYVEGLPVRQMAQSRGVSEKAVESLLARSRRAFARCFTILVRRRRELA